MTQATALEILKSGKSVFLTGAPGAGKTYTLNHYVDYARAHDIDISITASTGIAASHIGGTTLHSFAGLGLQENIDDIFLKNLLQKKRKVVARIKDTKILIIDEISMVSPEVFASVDTIMKRVRLCAEPFGGVQLIVSGDFFQLPPVVQGARYTAGESQNRIRYAWQTDVWRDLAPAICYLSERHRHDDDAFLTILDEIRGADVQEESLELLRGCYKRPLKTGTYTRLYTHNADVDRINQQALQQLDTQAYRYPAVTTGQKKVIENIFASTLASQELILKEGATVIFIKNDPEGKYVNGTIGTIEKFDKTSKRPIVKTFDNKTIAVHPMDWTREDESKVLGQVRQLPLRLAWAITVHKSQGMTLDAAEIDLSKSFEVGQGYVALSRVKNLAGLRLMGLNDVALVIDPVVGVYDTHLHEAALGVEQKYDGLSDMEKEKLFEEFIKHADGSIEKSKKIKKEKSISQKRDTVSAYKGETYDKTLRLVEKGLSIVEIATERGLARKTIAQHIIKIAIKNGPGKVALLRPADAILKKVGDVVYTVKKKNNPEDFLTDGRVRARVIYDELHESVDYDDIHLALIFLAAKE